MEAQGALLRECAESTTLYKSEMRYKANNIDNNFGWFEALLSAYLDEVTMNR